CTSVRNSKSCHVRKYVIAATPMPAKAKPIKAAPGSARIPHTESTNPSRAATTRKETAYRNPRKSAHAVSPTVTSAGPTGVARIASYVFAYFIFQKTFDES